MNARDFRDLTEAYYSVYANLDEANNTGSFNGDNIEYLISYLLDEGYFYSIQEAEDFIDQLNDDELNYIIEGFVDLTPEKEDRVRRAIPKLLKKVQSHHDTAMANAQEVVRRREHRGPIATLKHVLVGTAGPASRGRKAISKSRNYANLVKNAQNSLTKTQASRDAANIFKINQLRQKLRDLGADPDAKDATNNIRPIRRSQKESYEILVSYLLDEGYVNTVKNAEIIIENMSDEWINSILEGSLADMIAAQNKKLKDESDAQQSNALERIERIRKLLHAADPEGASDSTPSTSQGPSMSPLDRVRGMKKKIDDAQQQMNKFDKQRH